MFAAAVAPLRPRSSSPLSFHLLEITIISAQELAGAAKSNAAYAVAWAHPSHKLATRTDPTGGVDPAWNDKFVFRVDDSFLSSETSAVTIQILAARRHRLLRPDPVIGTVRVIISALHPSSSTRFVALQVRRPSSLRPQGILNLGVALLDASPPTLPLYFDLGAPSAFAYRDLISHRRTSNPKRGADHDADRAVAEEPMMRRNASVAVGKWVGEREKKELELKLEKWRTDLSPWHDMMMVEEGAMAEVADKGDESRGAVRRRRRAVSCFCGGTKLEREQRRSLDLSSGGAIPSAFL